MMARALMGSAVPVRDLVARVSTELRRGWDTKKKRSHEEINRSSHPPLAQPMTRNALHRGVVLAAALAALAGSSLASSCSSFESALQRFWNFGIEPRAPFSYALRGADWGGDCSSGARQSPVALLTTMDDVRAPYGEAVSLYMLLAHCGAVPLWWYGEKGVGVLGDATSPSDHLAVLSRGHCQC